MLVQNKYHITRVMFQKTQDRVESRMLLSTLEVDLGGGGAGTRHMLIFHGYMIRYSPCFS